MSQCYNLVCPATKRAIWVGQGDRIYTFSPATNIIAQWLHEHQDKAIFFVNDDSELLDGIPIEDPTDVKVGETPTGNSP